MRIGRCPTCHHHLDLEALAQDESARDLQALVARTPHTVMVPLLTYLGLFRPAKKDLRNDRALRLAEEVLELTSDQHLLGAALRDTVEQIHKKRQGAGDNQPLKNHNYLRQVMATIAARIGQSVPAAKQSATTTQKPSPVHADDDAAWRRQMAKLGYDVDSADGGKIRRLPNE